MPSFHVVLSPWLLVFVLYVTSSFCCRQTFVCLVERGKPRKKVIRNSIHNFPFKAFDRLNMPFCFGSEGGPGAPSKLEIRDKRRWKLEIGDGRWDFDRGDWHRLCNAWAAEGKQCSAQYNMRGRSLDRRSRQQRRSNAHDQ